MIAISKCIWCANDLPSERMDSDIEGQDFTILPIKYGVCPSCTSKMGEIVSEDISHIERRKIDNLPYGTILLDTDGKILIYNQTEANLAKLEIESVEGKFFFSQIAPCTSVKEFKGEFDLMVKNDIDDQIDFKFEFVHKNFQAKVKILMTYFSSSNIISLLIRKIDDD